jgi:hypothetical protein
MFCSYCGDDVSPTAAFCSKCGTRIAPPQTGAPPASGNLPAGAIATVPYQTIVVRQQDESTAILSMVFGILSLAGFGILTGIPAIILGTTARRNIRASGGRLSGDGMATAGIVLGWISCGIVILVVFVVFIVFVFAAAASQH